MKICVGKFQDMNIYENNLFYCSEIKLYSSFNLIRCIDYSKFVIWHIIDKRIAIKVSNIVGLKPLLILDNFEGFVFEVFGSTYKNTL